MAMPLVRNVRRVMVVAAPGFGKSAAVRSWLASGADGWFVFEDLPALDADAAAALAAQIEGLPASARVVLVGRTPWPGRPPADITVVDATELALSEAEVVRLLVDGYGLTDAALATRVVEVTGGWPSLVDLAGRHLRHRPLSGLTAPGGPIESFVTERVLAGLPAHERRMLRRMVALDEVYEDLVPARDRVTVRQMARTGLLMPTGSGSLRVVPAIADVVARREPLPAPEVRRLNATAAGRYADRRLWGPALTARLRAGDASGAADLLREHGSDIIAAGGAGLVIGAFASAVPGDRLLLGEALTVAGRLDDALAELVPLAAGRAGVEAGLAWRLATVYYARAEHRAAFDILGAGRLGAEDTADEAFLLATLATVHWSLGEADACVRHAERARVAAKRAGDQRALAAAHVALALHAMLTGDRSGNVEHYAKALRAAESAGDAVQIARIRANRVAQFLEEARYPEALDESVHAVAAAESVGHATALLVALVNRAEALTRLGDLTEAERCGERALAIGQRAGSRKVAYSLVVLGDLRARRGQRSLARAAYEEAVRIADADGALQCLVPALSGLARVVAADDPAAGRVHAKQAVARAGGPLATGALLSVGWVAVAAGDLAAAGAAADDAERSARLHRDRAGLAEVLELRAAAGGRPADRRRSLREAARTWRATGAQLDADRVTSQLGLLPGASAEERLAARSARAALDAAGVVSQALTTGEPTVAVRVLGRFEVSVDDVALPPSAWQSRKARDLLRILVARRGRRVAREELAALLWPDDDGQRVAHRLSVALSTLRTVLDPDRRFPANHYLFTSPAAMAADVTHLDIDLEEFLAEAEAGRRLAERGRLDDARKVLAAAERRYAGEVFEDEPYDDWSVPVREEARAAYLRIARLLAGLAHDRGATDDAIGYLLKILACDPYDEHCHLRLVELLSDAGRHGEAERARTRYTAAMRKIGRTTPAIEPTPQLPRTPSRDG